MFKKLKDTVMRSDGSARTPSGSEAESVDERVTYHRFPNDNGRIEARSGKSPTSSSTNRSHNNSAHENRVRTSSNSSQPYLTELETVPIRPYSPNRDEDDWESASNVSASVFQSGFQDSNELQSRYLRVRDLARSYKAKLMQLTENLKSAEKERDRLQQNSRRVDELKEQLELDKKAKQDLENMYNQLLTEKDGTINALQSELDRLTEAEAQTTQLRKQLTDTKLAQSALEEQVTLLKDQLVYMSDMNQSTVSPSPLPLTTTTTVNGTATSLEKNDSTDQYTTTEDLNHQSDSIDHANLLVNLKSQSDELRGQLDESEKLRLEQNEELDSLKDQLSKYQDIGHHYELASHNCDQSQKRIDELSTQLETLKEELNNERALLEESKERESILLEEQKQLESVVQTLSNKTLHLEMINENMQSKQQNYEELEEKFQRISQCSRLLQTGLKEVHSKISPMLGSLLMDPIPTDPIEDVDQLNSMIDTFKSHLDQITTTPMTKSGDQIEGQKSHQLDENYELELSELRTQLDNALSTNQNLETQLQSVQSFQVTSEAELERLRDMIGSLKNDLEMKQAELDKIANEHALLEQELNESKLPHPESDETIRKLESEKLELSSTNQKLEQDLETTQFRAESLQKQVHELNTELSTLRDKTTILEANLAKSESLVQSIREESEHLKKSFNEIIQNHEKELEEKLIDQANQMRAESADLSANLESLRNEQRANDDKVNVLTKEKMDLLDDLNGSKLRIEQLESELLQTKQDLLKSDESATLIVQLRNEIESLRHEHETTNQLDELKTKLEKTQENYQNQLDQSEHRIRQLVEQSELLNQSNLDKDIQIQNLSQDLDQVRNELDDLKCQTELIHQNYENRIHDLVEQQQQLLKSLEQDEEFQNLSSRLDNLINCQTNDRERLDKIWFSFQTIQEQMSVCETQIESIVSSRQTDLVSFELKDQLNQEIQDLRAKEEALLLAKSETEESLTNKQNEIEKLKVSLDNLQCEFDYAKQTANNSLCQFYQGWIQNLIRRINFLTELYKQSHPVDQLAQSEHDEIRLQLNNVKLLFTTILSQSSCGLREQDPSTQTKDQDQETVVNTNTNSITTTTPGTRDNEDDTDEQHRLNQLVDSNRTSSPICLLDFNLIDFQNLSGLELANHFNQWSGKLVNLENALHRLEFNLLNLNKRNSDTLQSTIKANAQFEQMVSEFQLQLDQTEQIRSNLESQLMDSQSDFVSLKASFDRELQKSMELQQNLAKLQSRAEEWKLKADCLETEQIKRQDLDKRNQSRVDELEVQLTEFNRKYELIVKEKTQSDKLVEESQMTIEALNETCQELRKQIEDISREHADLMEATKRSFELEMQQLSKRYESEKIDSLEQLKIEHQTALNLACETAVANKSNQLQSQIKELKTRLKKALQENETTKKSVSLASTHESELKSQIEKLDAQSTHWQDQYEKQLELTTELQSRIEQLIESERKANELVERYRQDEEHRKATEYDKAVSHSFDELREQFQNETEQLKADHANQIEEMMREFRNRNLDREQELEIEYKTKLEQIRSEHTRLVQMYEERIAEMQSRIKCLEQQTIQPGQKQVHVEQNYTVQQSASNKTDNKQDQNDWADTISDVIRPDEILNDQPVIAHSHSETVTREFKDASIQTSDSTDSDSESKSTTLALPIQSDWVDDIRQQIMHPDRIYPTHPALRSTQFSGPISASDYEALQLHNADLQNQLQHLTEEFESLRAQCAAASNSHTHEPRHYSVSSPSSVNHFVHPQLSQPLGSGQTSLAFMPSIIPFSPNPSMNSLNELVEYEYLKNVLFEYMIGRETPTLAKVLCSLMRFNAEQTRKVLNYEDQKSKSWVIRTAVE